MKWLLVLMIMFYSNALYACDEAEAKSILQRYHWQTEDYPPYNYPDSSGQLVGIFTEVLGLVYQELGLKFKTSRIEIVPWARLVYNMKRHPEFAAFSMVSTVKREREFKLVALPVVIKSSIMVLNNNHAKLQQKPLNELTIAVVRGDIGQALLEQKNIQAKQVETNSASNMLNLLLRGRVDAISYAEDVAYFQFNKLGINKNSIVPIYLLNDNAYANFVFHNDTPNCVVNMFNEAITQLAREKKLKPIWDKYLE